MSDEFVGKGFPFPMRINESGSFTLIEGTEELERSMAVVLSTAPGERPFRPAFGCRIWELMFEPIETSTMGLMERALAISAFAPLMRPPFLRFSMVSSAP